MEEQKDILIINSKLADTLVQLGYKVTRILPNKHEGQEQRSVFYFEYKPEILNIKENFKNK